MVDCLSIEWKLIRKVSQSAKFSILRPTSYVKNDENILGRHSLSCLRIKISQNLFFAHQIDVSAVFTRMRKLISYQCE